MGGTKFLGAWFTEVELERGLDMDTNKVYELDLHAKGLTRIEGLEKVCDLSVSSGFPMLQAVIEWFHLSFNVSQFRHLRILDLSCNRITKTNGLQDNKVLTIQMVLHYNDVLL